MIIDTLDIRAPLLFDEPCNEVEVMGATVWLWMHSRSHSSAPLHALSALLLPVIRSRQFVLVYEQGKPVFYFSWACMDAEAEARYLRHLPILMKEADWTSGDRAWVVDWVAPFGHTGQMREILRTHLFPNQCFRFLYHKGRQRNGLMPKSWHGRAMGAKEAQAWLQARPMDLPDPAQKKFITPLDH